MSQAWQVPCSNGAVTADQVRSEHCIQEAGEKHSGQEYSRKHLDKYSVGADAGLASISEC